MTHYQTPAPHQGAIEIAVNWLSSLHRQGWQNAFINLYQELLVAARKADDDAHSFAWSGGFLYVFLGCRPGRYCADSYKK
jgi:hypothetical protein